MEVERQCNDENQNASLNNVQPEIFFEKAYEIASRAAATGLGQFAIEKIDTVLSALENTAKWSLPQAENIDKGATSPILERPLPWIPFLATIVALRAVRLSLSFASVLIGNEPVSPSDLVYFLQTRRRKLRAIKYHGLRSIRLKKQDSLDRQRRGVIGKLGSIFGSVVCRTGYRNESPARVVVKKKKSKKSQNKTQKSVLNASKSQKKKLSQDNKDQNKSDDDDKLSFEQILDKYAQHSDNEDSDFNVEENFSESSSETMSEYTEDDQTTEIERRLLELNRKQEEDEIEKKKEMIDQIIQERREQIENEIKYKLESQIEERIEKHAQALKAKLDEKIEEIQNVHDNTSPILDNPTSVSINPAKLSPKIAHNGNADENKTENPEKIPNDVIDFKGNENYLIDEISIKLKLRSEKGCKSDKRQLSSGSSSEDLYYSPIASPGPDRNVENHSAVKDIIKQREAISGLESNMPFIENEIKSQIKVHLKQTNNNKKQPTSINSSYKPRKAQN